ncbi:PepSY-associated TM helix domain-containing protein [Allomuricauda sp. F6463D]|uniref:PepSY-associated TM helix domain-containing protein n=1 Tax=Allomuricauda sp. F6463D TaxID=2926409 RepID=UPI001FF13519|nr:PepSY-associated TM helix domain-containing protein [Muricauda sp. F6463D]MCK0159868.1 PepSY domain-containing protein [Muricauda sp. F6463D]
MNRKKQASILRSTRNIHRKTGILLFFFFIIVGMTGAFLGWKKHVDVLQYPTKKGISQNAHEWLSMDSIMTISTSEIQAWKGPEYSSEIDKIDVRPDKGIVKIIYKEHYYSLQLDATSGKVLSHEYRASDLMEHLHDGAIVDRLFGIPGEMFKLVYSSILGIALVVFSITGFWLWYGPKRMKRK